MKKENSNKSQPQDSGRGKKDGKIRIRKVLKTNKKIVEGRNYCELRLK